MSSWGGDANSPLQPSEPTAFPILTIGRSLIAESLLIVDWRLPIVGGRPSDTTIDDQE
jgi:hypothetical protein